jgi:hypothetical protein
MADLRSYFSDSAATTSVLETHTPVLNLADPDYDKRKYKIGQNRPCLRGSWSADRGDEDSAHWVWNCLVQGPSNFHLCTVVRENLKDPRYFSRKDD